MYMRKKNLNFTFIKLIKMLTQMTAFVADLKIKYADDVR